MKCKILSYHCGIQFTIKLLSVCLHKSVFHFENKLVQLTKTVKQQNYPWNLYCAKILGQGPKAVGWIYMLGRFYRFMEKTVYLTLI